MHRARGIGVVEAPGVYWNGPLGSRIDIVDTGINRLARQAGGARRQQPQITRQQAVVDIGGRLERGERWRRRIAGRLVPPDNRRRQGLVGRSLRRTDAEAAGAIGLVLRRLGEIRSRRAVLVDDALGQHVHDGIAGRRFVSAKQMIEAAILAIDHDDVLDGRLGVQVVRCPATARPAPPGRMSGSAIATNAEHQKQFPFGMFLFALSRPH